MPNDAPTFSDATPWVSLPGDGPAMSGAAFAARFLDRADLPQDDHFAVARDRLAFDALEADWNALFERAGAGHHIFQSFNWNWHWANNYLGEGIELAVVTVRRGGVLIMLWPLIIQTQSGARTLCWMGDPVSQYGDILADNVPDRMAVMRRAFDHALATLDIDALSFRKVRADATVAPLLAERQTRITGTEEAPYADLATAKTATAFEQRFKAKARKNRQRQRRRLEERGALAFEANLDIAATRDAVAACMTLKRAWLASKGLLSRALADRRAEAFFVDAVSCRTRPCGITLSVLRSAGEIADVNLAVTAKGTRALHMIAYGLKFEKFAPGALHLEDVFRKAFADGIARIDFLAPRHPYKMDWCDGTVDVNDHVLPLTPRGGRALWIQVDLVQNGAKTLLGHLPIGVRQAIAGVHRALIVNA
jgi:CelD/BcsL family acetyltransferase involved in cellulose biosynthesis